MQKSTIISIIVSAALIGGTFYFVSDRTAPSDIEAQNVEIRDGIQYATVTAKGSYSPRSTQLKGGLPTKLVVKTNGTYDCTASLTVRAVGFQKMLQPTGEEVIDLGTPKSGEKIQGVCGMGMYNFSINFN